MDLVGVVKQTHEILEKTRADSQPRFIEAVNYRFKGHSVVDPDKYRTDDEKQKWLKADPVLHFEHRLTEAKIVAGAELKKIQEGVDQEVDEVVKFADESPNPSVDELYRYVYGGEFEMAGRK
jgi:pyruvate dehydrogenase E1 component alpha subunit